MKLLGARVEVKPLSSNKTVGESIKIEVPEDSQQENQVGEVGLVGDGVTINVKTGDRVVYGKYSLLELPTDQGKLLIVDEGDIFLIL